MSACPVHVLGAWSTCDPKSRLVRSIPVSDFVLMSPVMGCLLKCSHNKYPDIHHRIKDTVCVRLETYLYVACDNWSLVI